MDKRESGYAPCPKTGESILGDHRIHGKIMRFMG